MTRLTVFVALLGMVGCADQPAGKPAGDQAKARERQEAIGASGIPGARGINRALEISDTAAARNQRLDSTAAQ